jgi:3-hydroxyacyl-[acyl-carrier-protein] dehydratase
MGSAERTFAFDHAAAEGHFPGNPIIPGAVLLGAAIEAIAEALGVSLSPCTIRSAKFYLPTRPGDTVIIEFTGNTPGSLRFECAVRGSKVLAGQIECNAAPTSP